LFKESYRWFVYITSSSRRANRAQIRHFNRHVNTTLVQLLSDTFESCIKWRERHLLPVVTREHLLLRLLANSFVVYDHLVCCEICICQSSVRWRSRFHVHLCAFIVGHFCITWLHVSIARRGCGAAVSLRGSSLESACVLRRGRRGQCCVRLTVKLTFTFRWSRP